ncbi:MAG: hypothetical protein GF317_13020 [Candidatus Lokiarchaeota archaeon]|nr:hypothetical protein [Candidatus Lokiarchaeota archaeon]MBD3200563.1 hypothetical protein [Candidatus Lokiarchaeota archaeon]
MTIDNILKFTIICNLLEIDLNAEDSFNKRLLIQKIFGFGIIKFLIYIKKENCDLRRDFLKVEPKIDELLRK